MDWWTEIRRHVTDSPEWRERVDRWRAEARRPRRSTHALASYAELAAIATAAEAAHGRLNRPHAWSPARVARDTFDPAPEQPLEHARRYSSGLGAMAQRFYGATVIAQAIHELVSRPSGYDLQLPATLPPHPAPSGPQASLALAHVTDASYGTAAARRQAFHRAAPRRFDYIK